jgi:hypothetical protein
MTEHIEIKDTILENNSISQWDDELKELHDDYDRDLITVEGENVQKNLDKQQKVNYT